MAMQSFRTQAAVLAVIVYVLGGFAYVNGDICYKANQQMNIRNRASLASTAVGNAGVGTVVNSHIKLPDAYKAEYVGNIPWMLQDAGVMSEAPCPGGTGSCANVGEPCFVDSDCCQPGGATHVLCAGMPPVCGAGAVATSVSVLEGEPLQVGP